MLTQCPIEDLISVTFDGQVALLDIPGRTDELVEGIQRLAQRRTIRAVECRGLNPFVTDKMIDTLSGIPTIRRLEFAYQPISDTHVDRLMALPELQELHIVGSQCLTPIGRQRIKQNERIREEIIGCLMS